MSDVAINVESLGKRYFLRNRMAAKQYKSLRETITGQFGNLFRRRRVRSGDMAVAETGEFWAVRDLSFEVKTGETVGIIGRNGAGKSTLLKLLSRVTEPTTGRIILEGRVASLLEVGTGFHPELTGQENIFLNGAVLGMTRVEIKARFDEIVAFAGVERFLDTPVKRYSSGMYMRLAFAIAAHLEPEILIVDEVLAVGDAAFQQKCLHKMNEVSSQGRTVLFVSHQINAIERLCSRVLLMEDGQIAMDSRDIRPVVRRYLFGSEGPESSTGSFWKRKTVELDNPWFSPLAFYLGDANGNPVSAPVRNDAELWIYLEAEVQTLDPALTVGYAIYTEQGESLYWSYQTDQEPAQWPRLQMGRMKMRSPFPARFLNEGTYRLELIGGLHHRQWLFEPGKTSVMTFFEIRGGLSESPLWTAKRPGLLAPVFPWTATA